MKHVGGDVSTAGRGHRGVSVVGMSELLVWAALTRLLDAQSTEDGDDLTGF